MSCGTHGKAVFSLENACGQQLRHEDGLQGQEEGVLTRLRIRMRDLSRALAAFRAIGLRTFLSVWRTVPWLIGLVVLAIHPRLR